MLRKDIFELVRYANELGYHVGMDSNGYLIDANAAKKLAESGLESIAISIDAVGEIHDEHDVEENAFTVLANGDVLVDSRVEIEEFEEYFGVKIPEGKFETLGGLIFHIIRKIPIPGEVVCYDNFEMVIESADERRIKKIRIRAINKMPKV